MIDEQGIDGYFIQGSRKTPVSLKGLPNTGLKNIFRDIKANAKSIKKAEALPDNHAMKLPPGTLQETVIQVLVPQYQQKDIISHIKSSNKNIFMENSFKLIIIDTSDGTIFIKGNKIINNFR